MKTNDIIIRLFIITLINGLIFTSCKDDDNDDLTPKEDEPKAEILSGFMLNDKVLKNIFEDPEKADYILEESFRVRARLTIEPGVKILMNENAYLYITSEGVLIANGTAEEKIIITGKEKQKGWWGYIQFESKHEDNIMDHVVIEYGGGHHDDAFKANLVLRQRGSVTITNSEISNSANVGIIIGFDNHLPEVNNINIHNNNSYPIQVNSNSLNFLNENIHFENNGIEKIKVIPSVIEDSKEWSKCQIPYFLSGTIQIHSDLVIHPGFHAIFDQNSAIQINQEGSLNAIGTLEDSIRFESEQPIKGYWNYIYFNTSYSIKNEFQYVSVSHGGGQVVGNANIYIRGGNTGVSNLKMSNSSVRNSSGFGIKTDNQGEFEDNGNNHFSGNELGDVGG